MEKSKLLRQSFEGSASLSDDSSLVAAERELVDADDRFRPLLYEKSRAAKQVAKLHCVTLQCIRCVLDILVITLLACTVAFFTIRDAAHQRSVSDHRTNLPVGSDYGNFVPPGEKMPTARPSSWQ